MTNTTTSATWATLKGHGKPETLIYFGASRIASANGTLVRVANGDRQGYSLISVETGESVHGGGWAGKFWAAPAEVAEVAPVTEHAEHGEALEMNRAWDEALTARLEAELAAHRAPVRIPTLKSLTPPPPALPRIPTLASLTPPPPALPQIPTLESLGEIHAFNHDPAMASSAGACGGQGGRGPVEVVTCAPCLAVVRERAQHGAAWLHFARVLTQVGSYRDALDAVHAEAWREDARRNRAVVNCYRAAFPGHQYAMKAIRRAGSYSAAMEEMHGEALEIVAADLAARTSATGADLTRAALVDRVGRAL